MPRLRRSKNIQDLPSSSGSCPGVPTDALTVGTISVRRTRRRVHRFPLHDNEIHNRASSVFTPAPAYDDCGDSDYECQFCGATFWSAERATNVSRKQRPRYNQCCKEGRVRLRLFQDPPLAIQQLYLQPDFLDNIRVYNSIFSMTSFGANVDSSINDGSSPYVFRVKGQVCHWIGTLCPLPNEKPRFLQMYVYDTKNELSNRLSLFASNTHSDLRRDIIELLMSFLAENNIVVNLFRSAKELCCQTEIPDFSIRLYHSVNSHSYDLPSSGTIGTIVYDCSSTSTDLDIVIHSKDGHPQRISKLHPLYMTLQYPLLFLYGEAGWSPDLQLTCDNPDDSKKLTMNMYYSFLIHDRQPSFPVLLRAGRLFQQFLVDAYICIEQSRLDFVKANQNKFRTEILQGIHDAVLRGDHVGSLIGKRVIPPSSFTGGPRYMYKHYQDALAICRVHGNPQYFITFTCNVNWPEIKRFFSSRSPLKPQDRPDIIARIFRLKVKAFVDYLKNDCPFGTVVGELYTIEFQKRGLPHCHLLLWVAETFRIKSPEQLDQYISAEIPDPTDSPELYRIVSDSMMHGPCGLARLSSPCMVDGSCSKLFPKPYQQNTIFDKNGYAHYKRRPTSISVKKGDIQLDNSFVVPYNRNLCLRFQAHTNVEYCGWNMVIKYLFKYISKGTDKIKFSITKSSTFQHDCATTSEPYIDEVGNYVDSRFICPHEASWRILDFPIHHRNPAVQVLAIHLENMQNVQFRDTQHLQEIIDNQDGQRTTLTQWLSTNQSDESGRHLRYVDFLNEYRWDQHKKTWFRRLRKGVQTGGRLIYIHPTCGEAFYLRMLLGHQTGCTSFSDIRTVNGVTFPTFRSACEKLGLLEDDDEWSCAFEEAACWATASELRSLFAHMLLYCEITNPVTLWHQQWKRMSDDIAHNLGVFRNSRDAHIDDADAQQYVLYELELLLNSNSSPSSLNDFGLPTPRPELLQQLKNRLLMEEKNFDRHQLAVEHEKQKASLKGTQLSIYESVITSVKADKQILMFVYGHGGTGKTYLWSTIINALRSEGKIVLTVAASGIASLLLPAGRTAHSRFKLPLDITNESLCYIKKNTHLASLLIQTSLVIWDEAPMSDRKCFEALDRTLKDILDNNHSPFSGKSVLLGGDFRQTLPIKRKAGKQKILEASLPRYPIWDHFKVVKLTENMRLKNAACATSDIAETVSFASWLVEVGDGAIGIPAKDNPLDTKFIEIPTNHMIPHSENSLRDLVNFIYDKDSLDNPTASNMSEKAIVCPKNAAADEVNSMILSVTPGQCAIRLSTDSIIPHSTSGVDIDLLYPAEYLNQLNFSGLPPHKLSLKVGAPILLLRNINQSAGLCNGTRLIITQLLPRMLEAQVITGTAVGHKVYIPRIILTHNDPELPFVFKRKQFPVMQ